MKLLLLLLVTLNPTITEVTDGDTIITSERDTLRLAYIDAPESWPSDKLYEDAEATGLSPHQIRELGKRSAQVMRKLVLGKEVRVRIIEEGYYGRQIAFVYLEGEPVSVNLQMVLRGYAAGSGPLQTAEEKARSDQRGFYQYVHRFVK